MNYSGGNWYLGNKYTGHLKSANHDFIGGKHARWLIRGAVMEWANSSEVDALFTEHWDEVVDRGMWMCQVPGGGVGYDTTIEEAILKAVEKNHENGND